MNYAIATLISVFLLLGFLVKSDEILILASVAATPLAFAFLMSLARQLKIYTAIFFTSHLAMYFFTLYVLVNSGLVVPTPEFDFSVFTDENLRTALMGLALTLIAIGLVCSMFGKRFNKTREFDLYDFLVPLFGKLGHLGQGAALLLILASFMCGIGVFFSGTTVIEIQYPLNVLEIPFPSFLLLVPQLLAATALGIILFKTSVRVVRDASHRIVLQLARINFVVSPILCLMVAGARGFTTFMWLFFACLELYVAAKRKTGMMWGLIFLILAYFAYSAWPFLRANLSSLPLDEAFKQGMQYALWMNQDTQFGETIDLSGYWMIGQSLFHFLYVIQLYADGISLAGATFFNLIPQVLPEFLDGVLWDRPLNDNWILGHYYFHGGGFFALANAYWNGGMVTMTAFVACILALFLFLDNHLQKPGTSTWYRWTYIAVIPIISVQLFYGIQGLVRPLELLLLIVVLEKVRIGKTFPRLTGYSG